MTGDLTYLFDPETGDLSSIDASKRNELLGAIEELGMLEAAAAEVGLTSEMIADALAQDTRLESDIALAKGRYKATVLRRLAHLAFKGSEKAIVGGRNKDEILGTDVIPNDKALELLTKMQFPDDLATVTRQRITAEIKPGARDEVKADFSKLPRDDRADLARLIQKAQTLITKVDQPKE